MPCRFQFVLAMRRTLVSMLVLFLVVPFGPLGGLLRALAQEQSNQAAGPSPEELQKLVGPIALYPDELVGIVLPASTNALQVVQAARFLEKQKKDSSLKPDKEWDSSVIGLLNYPEVIEMMNKDLEWTQALGDAVINNQAAVLDAVQQFRTQAQTAGNLKSNDKQVIVQEKEIIKIVPADPQVIYVPTYQPTTVIYQPTPVVYSNPYPPYWATTAAFFTGMFVGSAVRYGVGWGGYGRGSIDVNRSVKIDNSRGDVNINTGGGKGQKWQPNKQAKQRSSSRQKQHAKRPSQKSRAKPGRASGSKPGSRPGGQHKGQKASRPGSQPSKKGGNSFSGYKSGQQAHQNSNRGAQSRGQTRSTAQKPSTNRGRSMSGHTSGNRARTHSSRGKSSRGGGGSHRGGGGRRR